MSLALMRGPVVLTSVPVSYRWLTWLLRRQYRGSTRLYLLAQKWGLFRQIGSFTLVSGGHIYAPLYTDNAWDETLLQSYEADLFTGLREAVAALPRPLCLLDGGASFGLFSSQAARHIPGIERIIAFEPNAEMFRVLQLNLDCLTLNTAAHNAALSHFVGKGELRSPKIDGSPDAKYLALAEDGTIPVVSIDSLGLTERSLLIKLDIEGGELDALRGAEETIRTVPHLVIVLESNAKVTARTGVDLVECLRFLNALRPIHAYFAEGTDRAPIPLDRPLLAHQPKPVSNVIVTFLR